MIKKLKLNAFVTLPLIIAMAALLYGQGIRPSGTLEDLKVPAPSLAGNLLGDLTTQHVFVYLPPSYKTSAAKRFPTLYLLHGYTGSPEGWVKDLFPGSNLQSEMDSLIAKAVAGEMIVVVPNGRNAYLGSFYSNSTVTGQWEDYIYRDLISFVDGRYRTIAKSESRGIAGHSMGGYGAFMLAMKHPDVFGAVYALSPCCLGFEGDLSMENPAWSKAAKFTSRDVLKREPESFQDFLAVALTAAAAAFSPNTDRPPLYVDLPFIEKDGATVRSEPAYTRFREKMPLYILEQYRNNLIKLRGIAFDVGEFDEFSHIRRTTGMLSAELSTREIPHMFEIYKGGNHQNKVRERFETKLIPFFSAILER